MEITVKYFQKCANWGDALNPYLLAKIFPAATIVEKGQEDDVQGKHLLAIGSIIHWASEGTIVWGTGAILPNLRLAHRPKSVLAVRGPLTRRVLKQQGVPCPDVYGDPALLLPRFYRPASKSTHSGRVGIIPHYVDKDSGIVKRLENAGAKAIDVFAEIEHFVDDVCSCRCILSSSLHGLICADAYGIPARWITLSKKVIGDGFKFRDYYLSRGMNQEGLQLTGDEKIDDLVDLCRVEGSLPDLDRLMSGLIDQFHSGTEKAHL